MGRELPNGWIRTTLGEIAKWGSGGTPNRSKPEYYGGNIPWIKTGDLNDSVITEVSEYITELGLKNSSAKLFPKGSIGLAMYGATIGKTAFFGIDASTNQACAVAQPSEAIIDRFLHNYLKSQKQNFIEQGKGGAQPNISQTLIKAHPILLPPLPEQKCIVARLDALFEHLDVLKTKLDRIPGLLKNFRQQVLTQAVTGKLTEEWRTSNGSLEDAVRFVTSINEERKRTYVGDLENWKANKKSKPRKPYSGKFDFLIFDKSNISDWCRVAVSDISTCLDFMRKPINRASRSTMKGDIPYYGANGQVDSINTFLFNEDLVCVVEDETFVGRTLPFSYVIRGKSWVNNHAHVLRPDGGMSADFLNILLSFYNFLPLTSGSTGRRKLTQKGLMEAPIDVPGLSEQDEIVKRVKSLFALADKIEYQYQSLKAKIDNLPLAILNKAFKGELVPQDPNDEPASVLLELIKSEREGKVYRKKEDLSMAAEERGEYG